MCNCLGKWGFLGLRLLGPLGRDFWFYPTEIRKMEYLDIHGGKVAAEK
jgi:hypothetical protein